MALFLASIVAAALAMGIRGFWLRCPDLTGRGGPDGFRRWFFRGLAVPLAGWYVWHLLVAVGPAWGMVPLTPNLGSGTWASLVAGTAVVTLVASLVWTAFSLACLLPDVVANIRRRGELMGLLGFVGGLTLLLAASAAWWQSWILFSAVVTTGLWLLLQYALLLIHLPTVNYARAIARIQMGKYAEAEQEVLGQLEEKADDYKGWMMLATLYAEQFDELSEARRTVHELCAQPGLTPYQISHAFTRLADWHLSRGDDPAGARAALTEIQIRCADTPFALSAEHRLRHLPLDDVELRERRQPRILRLPALSDAAPPPPSSESPGVQLLDARSEAGQLTARLAQRPDDEGTRIRLARLLAERLGRVDEAITHLTHLRSQPGATSGQKAEWLSLEAAWELKLRHRELAASALLERLRLEHPDTPQAMAARRQLQLLEDTRKNPQPPPCRPTPPPRIVVRLPEPPGPPDSPPDTR